jgi:hypothetical protein
MKLCSWCAVLVLIGAVCAATVSGAAEIVLDAPPIMSTSFDGGGLGIPVSLIGSKAMLQLVIVEALDYNIPPWTRKDVPTPEERFVQGLDPLVYVGPQKLCPEGVNVVEWYERDMEGQRVPYNAYRYYVFAFVLGAEPDSLDYGLKHRSEFIGHVAGMVTGNIIGYDMPPNYPLEHFTDIPLTAGQATINISYSFQHSMEYADEIGVLSPRGDLVGAFLMQYRVFTPGSFLIHADDPATPEIEGMREGEPMTFVIWDYQTDMEFPAQATFAEMDTLFASGTRYRLESLHIIDATAVSEAPPIPFTLHQNSPNPFNPVTAIPFSLAEPSDISLIIYNATGATVAVLAEGMYPPGRHSVSWDASDHASGLYFYRLLADGTALTGKMMLVK